MNNDYTFLKVCSKVVDLNNCINNQKKVLFNTTNDNAKNKLSDGNFQSIILLLTAGNEESSDNKTI